eukprot:EG_transcript_24165
MSPKSTIGILAPSGRTAVGRRGLFRSCGMHRRWPPAAGAAPAGRWTTWGLSRHVTAVDAGPDVRGIRSSTSAPTNFCNVYLEPPLSRSFRALSYCTLHSFPSRV